MRASIPVGAGTLFFSTDCVTTKNTIADKWPMFAAVGPRVVATRTALIHWHHGDRTAASAC